MDADLAVARAGRATDAVPRGRLRVYLGAAPGVGKTYAMLDEGQRRRSRGTRVLVGAVETHGRPGTIKMLDGLEHAGEGGGVDVDVVLRRQPGVVLIDDLAALNPPRAHNRFRWQDVDELLAHGIDVVTTLDVSEIDSLADVAASITGRTIANPVPDGLLDRAEEVQFVDQTPEAIRRRLAHGNIFPAESVDAAVGEYFSGANLLALRELALGWMTDRASAALVRLRAEQGIEEHWESRERVLVALKGSAADDALLRRAARIAHRTSASLSAVHIRPASGLSDPHAEALTQHRRLLTALGGTYREVASGNIAESVVAAARAEGATQIVLGASSHSRLGSLLRGSVVGSVVRSAAPMDVHIIDAAGSRRRGESDRLIRRASRRALSPRRLWTGWALAVLGPIAVTPLLVSLRSSTGRATDLLAYVLAVLAAAAVGGMAPAFTAAGFSFVLANWYFTPPYHTLTISDAADLFDLAVFIGVAAITGFFVSASARRQADAARSRAHAKTLAELAGSIAAGPDPLPALLDRVRLAFNADYAAVTTRAEDGSTQMEGQSGEAHSSERLAIPLDANTNLTLIGDDIEEADIELLLSCAGQIGVGLQRRRMLDQRAHAERVRELNELREALLAAVSHDLRTPLSSIKASASLLRQRDVVLAACDRDELLATIENETDRLTDLITNLVGMSRIQAGAVQLSRSAFGLEEVVSRALAGLDRRGHDVVMELDERLPAVYADATLLERVIANVLDNAFKWSPAGAPVRISAAPRKDRTVSLYIADRGAGIPFADRARVFQPFQRLNDRQGVTGTGLGLAVARGFMQLLGGTITVEDTPGGGTTIVIAVPAEMP